ncbi:MAG: hypothetical protein HQL69_22240 [Magnetococcales bacterium]|nr:hypothetical protein [Magnetococcales bacterium]
MAPLFIGQARAEESWADKVRGTWERVKGIGNKGVETAEEIAGKKQPEEKKNEGGNSKNDGHDRSKGWDRAKEVGGKALGSERSKHQRENGDKGWKKDKNYDDDDDNGKGRGKGKGKGRGNNKGKGKGHK